jgi:hypothetical protein
MTRRASDHPLRKVTLNLYAADMDALLRFYGNGRVSEVIQKLVHRHVTSIQPLEAEDEQY